MEKIEVGQIEEYPVLYIPEKDLLYCKKVVFPYKTLEEALINSTLERIELREDLIITKKDSSVQLACLTTSISNIKLIHKTIKKYKNGKRIS